MPVSLKPGFQVVALKIQEAADMAHSDVRAKLQSAVSDAHSGSNGGYGYYVDHTGDGESGDCIYSSNGDMKKAPYEISSVGGKSTTNLDTDNAVDVTPTVSYDELADDDDHYASMEEAFAKSKTYTDLPLYERFISKGERDSADDSSFAGKNKSFPILKASDVSAAVHAMGRAGSDNYGPAQLKANIIRIAKAKGFASELPKAWQGADSKESKGLPVEKRGTLVLTESIDWTEQEVLILIESAGSVEREIKIMAAGPGSSAVYPAEVLKRDGPKTFTKNTQIYINHATKAEEAARPEGDWHKLVGALSTNAYWKESATHGDGLFAMAKFASDLAPSILEKAPWSGMSIRANGTAAVEAGRTVTKNGLPVLASFTGCESIDIVTKAGAGGMILTEAARRANHEEVEMTEAEVKRLIESSVAAATSPLRERAVKGDAIVVASKVLSPLAFDEAAKQFVIENVLRGSLPLKEGELDETKLTELVTAEAKRVGALFGAVMPNAVRGFGAAEPVTIDPKVREAELAAEKDSEAQSIRIFESLGMPKDAATFAAKGRAA